MRIFTYLLCLLGTYGFAADFYVSPSGSDAGPGSLSSPWKTLQFSVDQLAPGDILHVLDGTFNEKISINVSGTVAQPITITGFDHTAILSGTGITSQEAMIEIVNRNNLIIEFLTIQDNAMNDASGIYLEGSCQNIQLRYNKIFDIHFSDNATDPVNASTNAQPIIAYGTNASLAMYNLVIEGNEVANCRTGYSEGIAVNGNVDSFYVYKNNVHDLTNIGIDIIGHEGVCPDPAKDVARHGSVEENTVYNCVSEYATSAGIYVDGARTVAVIRNLCYGNGFGIEVGCEAVGKETDSIAVRNNICYGNHDAGLAIGGYDYPTGSGKVSLSDFSCNTLYRNDRDMTGNGEVLVSYVEFGYLSGNVFFSDLGRTITYDGENNAFYSNYNLHFAPNNDESNLIGTDTSVYTLADFQNATGLELNSISGDPDFNDPEGNITPGNLEDDFVSFNANSPIIDNGDPNYAPFEGETDFYGHMRVVNNRVDIGAAEKEVLSISELDASPDWSVAPNPAQELIYLPFSGNERYVITGLNGRELARGNCLGQEIGVGELASGTYIVTVYTEKGPQTCRFVKR